MKNTALVLLCGLVGMPGAVSQQQEPPAIVGYVTRVASNSDFDVNGTRILCGAGTESNIRQPQSGEVLSSQGCPPDAPYLGEPMKVFGSWKQKGHAVEATQIEAQPVLPGEIAGSAVIDALPALDSAGAQPGSLVVRADGYRILITSKTTTEWTSPLNALADVKAGDWIEYKGKQNEAGIVVAANARISHGVVTAREEKLHAKEDFDPSSVPASQKQSTASREFKGIDPKRFPPYDNPSMQARITEIGNKLIPAYQRDLPDPDPAKIHFRFQLIDTTWFRDALTVSNGIILVPHQVVERMQNDSQLAAVLAEAIAGDLEKIEYRIQPAAKRANEEFYGGMLVPLAGPVIQVAGMESYAKTLSRAEQQAERVSLGLLHDAGFDIDQAPVAWWLLAPKKSEPITEVPLPAHSAYLYGILGTVWHHPTSACTVDELVDFRGRPRHLANVCRARAATPAHHLRSPLEPLRRLRAKVLRIAHARPAPPRRVPSLAGVRIDHDRLVRSRAQFLDQRWDPLRRNAVYADGHRLRERSNQRGAIGQSLAVGNVFLVAARKAEPSLEFGPQRQRLAHRASFFERRKSLKSEKIRGLRARGSREHLDALAMEADQIVVGAVVVAVILAAVVQRRAIRPQRAGDENMPAGKLRNHRPRQLDGSQQRRIGALGWKSHLGIAHPRNLVTACGNALRARFDVGAMHGEQLFRLVLKDVRRPQRTVDPRTRIFELRGQAAVDDMNATQKCVALRHRRLLPGFYGGSPISVEYPASFKVAFS